MARALLGTGWEPLCEELEGELRRLDPPGELLEVGIDASGLPRFQIKLDRKLKAEGQRLERKYQNRALEVCESCGGPGRTRAGVIVTVRCDHCV